MKRTLATVLAGMGLAFAVPESAAHGEKHPDAKKKPVSTERYPWGREGEARKAARTIIVDLADTMRFTPSQIRVRQGETVKFIARNTGKTMHEMVIGTQQELQAHAELMKKHPGMEHDAPYMAHVAPGKQEEIVWTFDRPGTFMYGCLIPGHWEAGMKGSIVVAN